MRKLNTDDLWAFMRIVSEAGIREEIRKIAYEVQDNKLLEARDVGFDMILGIIERCSAAGIQKKVYEFLSGPLETDADTIGTMGLDELAATLQEFVSMNENGLQAFFSALSALLAK